MKVKTSELIGPALDWAVAKCEGATEAWRPDGPFWWNGVACIRDFGHDVRFAPSTDWSQGGPIIERERICVNAYLKPHEGWNACAYPAGTRKFHLNGPTPLIAAMRTFVASKLGDEVEIPEELL